LAPHHLRRRIWRRPASARQPGAVWRELFAEPEIRESDIFMSVKQNILQLQITVNNLLLDMKVLEHGNELREAATRLNVRQRPITVDIMKQIAVLCKLHRDHEMRISFQQFKELSDERVIKLLQMGNFPL
jgi:hypothetical protein